MAGRDRYIKVAGALLTGALAIAGCGKISDAPITSMNMNVMTSETSASQAETAGTAEATGTTEATKATVKQEPFVYDPHPYSSIVATEIAQDYWDSLYNMIDAVRAGKDTFECSSEDAYKWCMDSSYTSNYIPAVCMKITDKSDDGSKPYADGIGHIYYKMPVEELTAREADFEKKIEEVLNATIEKDDTEFEKCLKLYNYMESNYEYRHEKEDESKLSQEGYIYTTFMRGRGQCIDLSGVYAFLLRQAGVEALPVGCHDNVDHEWTYVLVNGRGYYIDPTWALKSERATEDLYLTYFMMTAEIRSDTGCPVDNLVVQLVPEYWLSKSKVKLVADDDRYYTGAETIFESLDEENKILYYFDDSGVKRELKYGEIE